MDISFRCIYALRRIARKYAPRKHRMGSVVHYVAANTFSYWRHVNKEKWKKGKNIGLRRHKSVKDETS